MDATRHSGLECLRIISIILIVSMHILGNTFHTSNLLNKEFILFVNTLGNTGVTLFILISGYFGIRFNTHKFFKMLVVVWFYSIVSYLIETIWLHTPHTWTGLASSLIPILSKKYWFMTCYVVLYCFSPYLNRLVQNLSQKSYEQLLLLWGFFFIFAPTILFFEIQNDTGKGIINVTLAYLIGQYLKVYGLPENMKRHSWDILSGSLAGIFILNSLLTAMSGNIILRFARDNNLLIIIASIMVFYQFTRWHFSSRIINYLAGYVFALYMLQGLLIHCLQPWYTPYADSNLLVLYFMGTLVSICLTTLVIEWSRRLLLGKIENKLADAMERRGAKIKMFTDNH